jgi:RNA polymerase sigma-70 factor, ECF subfamily
LVVQSAEILVPIYKSEDYLVQQAIKRDRAAFSCLYDNCIDKVYQHIFYRVSNQADAEDITQEVFTRAWKSIDKYRKTGAPFAAWLISIASNLIIDFYRKKHKSARIDEVLKNTPEGRSLNPEEQAEINIESSLVKAAVLKLKGDKQKVIIMHFIDGLSYREIAAALGRNENSIRVIQFRALNDMKRMLGKE